MPEKQLYTLRVFTDAIVTSSSCCGPIESEPLSPPQQVEMLTAENFDGAGKSVSIFACVRVRDGGNICGRKPQFACKCVYVTEIPADLRRAVKIGKIKL